MLGGGGGAEGGRGGGGGLCVRAHAPPSRSSFQACNTGCNAAAAATATVSADGVLTATKAETISDFVFLLLC